MKEIKKNQIKRVAELYYMQNLTQQEISKIIGISRPTVSRLLEDAKKLGIVEIKIDSSINIDNEISRRLRKKLGLKDVIVVDTYEDDYEKSLNKVGQAASEFFMSMLRPGISIGISWGKSIRSLVNNLDKIYLENVNIYQLVGGLNGEDYDSTKIAFEMASKFNVSPNIINAPAILENEQLATSLMKMPNIMKTIEEGKNVDMCVMGVGSFEEYETSLQRSGYINNDEKKSLIEKGASAHILSRVIDKDGNEITEFNKRSISIPLDSLKNKELSICIGVTKQKAKAILSVIKGKYANVIIIDKCCAEEILNIM